MITEELLYFIWRFHYFDHSTLKTTGGEHIHILYPGDRNTDSGPDFLQARIRIGSQLWAGNVEIHVLASDWNAHGHDADQAYNNVILHVVWAYDIPVYSTMGQEIPTLELNKLVAPPLIINYEHLMTRQQWIPCASLIPPTPDLILQHWLQRMMAERLERKASQITMALQKDRLDWETVTYHKLAQALGSSVNGEAMGMLAESTPLHLLHKHRDQLIQVEALLYGQSGLLQQANDQDEYVQKLQFEYTFLQNKYQLTPMNSVQWKFLRMRPANFPTIRIAQLARLVFQSDHLFSKCMAAGSVRELIHMLDITASHYWKRHYSFGTLSSPKEKHLGLQTIHHLIINTISPLLFAYGLYQDDQTYKDKAIQWLTEIPPEDNAITKGWTSLGITPAHAMDSQALIQLKKEYCDVKRCLHCGIGHQLIKGR